MALKIDEPRRQCIPIIYTRGTHYEVGFNVGRAFASIIQNFLNISEDLNDELLPAYNTTLGKKTYDATLNSVKANFPQYVRELEGTADGAEVPFHKLFLLHLDRIITTAAERQSNVLPVGCSSICVNESGNEILGHTEDALKDTLNHYYIVSAHIISEKPEGRWGVVEEKFTSLCYAGQLPGYTMSYNHHGLVFTINTLSAKKVLAGKTPRCFITRALLTAENFMQAQQILRDTGCGAADGCSINMTFLLQEGDRLFHNVEMAPAYEENMSQLNILTISPGESTYHCNSYQRLSTPELHEMMFKSSEARLLTLSEYKKPFNKSIVKRMLGDESQKEYPVFEDASSGVKTIAVGIFDCKEKTWSLYSDNPAKTEPLVVMPLVLKK